MRNDSQGRGIQIGRYLATPSVLNVGAVSASVQLLQNRHYRLWPSVDMFFQFGVSGVTASTNSHPATAKLDYLHYTDDTNTTARPATTARIDVSAPVEERLDEFPLSLPQRDEERGFSFRGHVVHGHTGLQVPEDGGTPAVVQRVLHVRVGVLPGTGGRKASRDPPNRNRKEWSSGCDRFRSWSAC